jgi:hypothetical protein
MTKVTLLLHALVLFLALATITAFEASTGKVEIVTPTSVVSVVGR